jgi:molybdopterin-guanine dinucleotide biosynthesis protein A
VTAIVLAGGRSSRFGGDKLAADLHGRPLLRHAVEACLRAADEVVVVLAPGAPPPTWLGADAAFADVAVAHDHDAFQGPLAGLLAGARVATGENLIVVGGDMPALDASVLRGMVERLGRQENQENHASARPVDAVLLAAADVAQPLPAALTRDAVPALHDAWERGARSLRAALASLDVEVIPEPEWRRTDPRARTLTDIDRPRDLDGPSDDPAST